MYRALLLLRRPRSRIRDRCLHGIMLDPTASRFEAVGREQDDEVVAPNPSVMWRLRMVEMIRMKRLLIIMVVAELCVPHGVQAYWWTGNKWPQGNPTTVALTITNSIPSAWAYPFGVGMAQWSNARAKFRFVTSTNSGHNIALKYLWFESALALTYIREGLGTRTTLDRDVDFNSKYSWDVNGAANKYDAHAVFVHELGHWLTLGDLNNSVDSEKTMYGKAAVGETKKRTLHSDDINGVRAIYGLK